MDDDNTLNDTGAVSVEDLDETRAGKLLVHLAKQNAIGGRRNLTLTSSTRYFVEAIKIAIATVNFQLAEILLNQSTRTDLLKEESFILHSAISGHFRNEADTSNGQLHWVKEPRKLLDDAGILTRIVKLLVNLELQLMLVRQRTFRYLLSIGADYTTLHDPVENGDLDGTKSAANGIDLMRSKVNLLEIALASRLRHETRLNDDFYYFPLKERGGELILTLMDKGLKCPRDDPALAKFLQLAAFEGNLPYVQKILDHDVDIGARAGRTCSTEHQMGSPLHIATMHAHKEVLVFLLSAGAVPSMQRDVHSKNGYLCRCKGVGCGLCKLMTPIEYAVDSVYAERIASKRNSDNLLECCEAILNAGASHEDAELVLREAARLDNIALVKRILDSDRPIRTVPLCQNIEAIELCLKAGIPMDHRAFQFYAVQHGVSELMEYVLTKSPPLLPVVIMGEILWWLVDFDYFAMAKFLIKVYAIDINQVWTIDFSFDYSDFKDFKCWFAPNKELLWQDFNLLQRAVADYYPTLDRVCFLLECGALVECPGLPLNALKYCREAAKTSSIDIFRSLMEYAEKQDLLQVPVVCEEDASAPSCSATQDNHGTLIWHFVRSELATPILGTPDQGGGSTSARAVARVDGIQNQLAASNLTEEPKSPPTRALTVHNGDTAQDVSVALTVHRAIVDQNFRPFLHQPLEGLHFIRLFELKPSTSTDDPIRGRLLHVNLPEAPKFEALSYVWGDAVDQIPILLNDSRFGVTWNLWHALFRLRETKSTRLLWIDSMCIDQQNVQERIHQVQMMREIYQSAERVTIWLGERTASGEDDLSLVVNSPEPQVVRKALERIASRPWFYRTWTMQEVVLAKKATVMIGSQSCDWGGINKSLHDDLTNAGSSYMPFHGLNAYQHISRLKDLCFLDADEPDQNMKLAFMFPYSSVCEATNPRDKVYGLLGMFERPLIDIDYRASVEAIYRKFTEAIIRRSGSLKILYKFGTKKNIDKLASWVPDYSISKPAGVFPDCYNDWIGDSSMGLPRSVKFTDDALIMTGVSMSRINALGDVLSEDTSLGMSVGSEGFRKILYGWETLACTLDPKSFPSSLPECFLEAITAQDYRQDINYDSAGILDWYNQYGTGPLKQLDKKPFIDYEDRIELDLWLGHTKDRSSREDDGVLFVQAPGVGGHYITETQGGRPGGGSEADVRRLTRLVEQVCYSRCFYTTDKGGMGLAPEGAQAGDAIVYFECGLYPFVLRHRTDGKWRMVGNCFDYPREFTDDEVPAELEARKKATAEFVIV